MDTIWGIDLGGTKIEGVVLEKSDRPEVKARLRVPTEAAKGYEHIIGQVAKLIDQLEAATGERPASLGIGTPGTNDPHSGLLKNSNTTCLNGKPFREDLRKKLGMNVSMANDANCFAMAESLLGIVRQEVPGARVVFGLIMGTGVGGGIVVGGKTLSGLHGIAGEWGHNFLDESGGPCYCGKTGCVETIISGPALERYYQALSGNQLKLKAIAERHQAGGDRFADQTMDRLVTFFGKGIAYIINILDPDAIVLGGGVGNIDLLYTRGVEEARKHVFNPKLDTPFLKPSLGDSAGVFGAALLS